jgi:hypothetical protein
VRIYMENESGALRAARLLMSVLASAALGHYKALDLHPDPIGSFYTSILMLTALKKMGVAMDVNDQTLRNYLREIANELPAFADDRVALLCGVFEASIEKMDSEKK